MSDAALARKAPVVSDWGKAFNKIKLQGECVGTTIDQFHKGEKGYTNICP